MELSRAHHTFFNSYNTVRVHFFFMVHSVVFPLSHALVVLGAFQFLLLVMTGVKC